MSDFISREAAIEEIDKWLDTVGTVLVGEGLSAYGELIGCIEDTPTADVAPVVHAKWIPFHSQAAGDIQYCSACDVGFDAPMGFCPHCGARMDGAAE